LAAIAVTPALSACGDSSNGSTTASQGIRTAGAQGGTDAEGGQDSSKKPPSAEEEVEQVGAEANKETAAGIVSVQHRYLSALGNRDYVKACSLVSRPTARSLQASVAPAGKRVACAEILSKVLGSAAAASARSQSMGDISKVRVMGDQAFVIFRAPGARLWVFSLVREGGSWRVSNLTSSVLAPSSEALGAGQ
jgi:hypothetical protein